MPKVHVFCSRAGLIRGGRSNPRYATHDQASFTAAQLRDLLEEPEVVVVLGGDELTEGHVTAAEKAEADAAKKAGR